MRLLILRLGFPQLRLPRGQRLAHAHPLPLPDPANPLPVTLPPRQPIPPGVRGRVHVRQGMNEIEDRDEGREEATPQRPVVLRAVAPKGPPGSPEQAPPRRPLSA